MKRLTPRFVERMPSDLEDGILYIGIETGTILHRCACGCGHEVNTPLGRTDWSFTYDGETISLWPSVGNWSFPCRSHYVVKKSSIEWAGAWSDEEVEAGRRADRALNERRYGTPETPLQNTETARIPSSVPAPTKRGLWTWVLGRLGL